MRTGVFSTVAVLVFLGIQGANLEAVKKYSERSKEVITWYESETTDMTSGQVAMSSQEVGTVVYEDTSHPLHLSKKTCIGMLLRDSETGFVQGSGTCRQLDSDGDVAWLWWQGSDQGGTWGWARGTGKYEGIKGEGSWTRPPLVDFADGGWVLEIDGTTELK